MLRIEVFSDVVCPWCFIGTHRLDRALASSGREAEIVYRPFLLSPDTPEEGQDVPEMLRKKYGADPRAMFARVEAAARESGLDLDLSKQRYSYPTLRAHTLLRHAISKGTQPELARALFRAHFVEARNVSDAETLVAIASEHGFSQSEAKALLESPAELAATREAAGEAHALGIRGVPFFVFARSDTVRRAELGARSSRAGSAVSGAQPESVLVRAMEQAAAQDEAAPG